MQAAGDKADKTIQEALQRTVERLEATISELKITALRTEMRIGNLLALLEEHDLLEEASWCS